MAEGLDDAREALKDIYNVTCLNRDQKAPPALVAVALNAANEAAGKALDKITGFTNRIRAHYRTPEEPPHVCEKDSTGKFCTFDGHNLLEPPRPSEPSAEETMIDKAEYEVMGECEHETPSGDCAAPHRVCLSCMTVALRDLVRAAKEEALMAVALKSCQVCAGGSPAWVRTATRAPRNWHYGLKGDWSHAQHGEIDEWHRISCACPAVWDALAALREGR